MPGKSSIIDYESCTIGWKNFKHLTKSELQLVNKNRYEATFNPGEIMLKQGSPTSNALFMANGMAKIYIEGIKGKNFIMSVVLPGMLIIGPGGVRKFPSIIFCGCSYTSEGLFYKFRYI